ncbi:MAG: YciI family protein [Micrococcus sp.]|nr:YciI family protein [Micrococcus sp.]
MPQFMISVWHAPGTQQRALGPYDSEEAMHAAFQAVSEFNESLQAEGAWVFACGLTAPEESSVVDGTNGGEPTVTKGPYAEASAHLGGLWVVEVNVPDQAHELAARASAACGQRVEVRQLQG